MLLQRVTFTGDVTGHVDAVRQANAGIVAVSGVRFLRIENTRLEDGARLEGVTLQGTGFRTNALHFAALTNQLIDRRQTSFLN